MFWQFSRPAPKVAEPEDLFRLYDQAVDLHTRQDLDAAINTLRRHIGLGMQTNDWIEFGAPPAQFRDLAMWLEDSSRFQDAVDVIHYWQQRVTSKANDRYSEQHSRHLLQLIPKAGTVQDRSTGDVIPFPTK